MKKNSAADLANLLADESFFNWISNKASPQESSKWNAWLNANETNRELYSEAIDLHKSIGFPSIPEHQAEKGLEKLNKRLDQHATASQLSTTIPTATADSNFSWWKMGITAVAAVVILLVTWQFATLSHTDSFQTLTTQFQEQQQINLPDGSLIILNANSTLRLPKDLKVGYIREFYLEGEAYFEVVSRPNSANKEFTVHTSDGSITVLGTVFAVYDRGSGTRVALEEGSVMVSSKTEDTSDESAVINLIPGQTVNFYKGDKILQPKDSATKLLTTWWKESFILDQTSVEDLAQRIQETYGVKLIIQDPDLKKRVLSGSIENHNLDIILTAISSILQAPVRRQGDTILLGNKAGKK